MTRRIRLLLFASLALNLLIAGVLIGWVLSPDGPRRQTRGPQSVMGAPFFEALRDEDRGALRSEMRRGQRRIETNREELRARFETLLDALASDPWDRDAVEDLLEEQRRVALDRQRIGESLLLDRLDAMTPDERRAYAERLEERVRRGRRR